MTTWTDDYIRSLVTDPGSLKDGRALSAPSKWDSFGRAGHAAWGLARGSAKEPYKIVLDLDDGASKCSCPSRKFPCKHAVGLMFLIANSSIQERPEVPAWVTTWIEGREKRAQPKPAAEPKPVDTKAQEKRQRAREAKVEAGLDELRRWLEDLARGGLDNPRVKTYAYWDGIAAHMVDAQMSPIAARLRQMGGLAVRRGEAWLPLVGEAIGLLYALTDAYARLDTLPEGLQADVRAALGFALKAEEVLASGTHVRDRWAVLGVAVDEEDKLLIRRSWLYGEQTGKYALLLDFAPKGRAFTTAYPLASVLDADLVYYPSAAPQRAVLKQTYTTQPLGQIMQPFSTINAMLDTYADALALNPFLDRIPAGIAAAALSVHAAADSENRSVRVSHAPPTVWLTAVTGGQPVPTFGEWDGESFRPLMLLADDGWTAIGVEQ